ncbi:MAG: DNA repair protein RecN [Saprospiraceae bacterium]|nr:DNA repair protein RecN [Saprospiraceae bacterium]
MLTHLYIQNYALIEELSLDCSEGLTAITGETGAGKSIIIGALQLLTGGRADARVFRSPSSKCVVEATFSCSPDVYQIIAREFDLDDAEGEIILRREIQPAGKSRCFVNDSPRLLQDMERLGEHLLVIHQQFDHLDFYDRKFQLQVLDEYASNMGLLRGYQAAFRKYSDALRKKRDLQTKLDEAQREREFVEFQHAELERADLKKGELSQLEQELLLVSRAEELHANGFQVSQLILREQGIADSVQDCLALLRPIQITEPLSELYARMENLKLELADIAREVERLAEQSDIQPERALQLSQRLDLLNALQKKHRVQTEDGLIEVRDSLAERLQQLVQADDAIQKLDVEMALHRKDVESLGAKLGKVRKACRAELEKRTISLLQKLGMPHARFEIRFTNEQDWTETGIDQASFYFSANKGNELKTLKEQSSGGELARFNLAIKSLVSARHSSLCLIFDEIDTGVSGQIALQMGALLRQIASHQQVICITHSPQVASRCNHHFYVYKEHADAMSATRLRPLNEQERIEELAKMLSGDPPTKAALKNALELLHLQIPA